MVQANPYAQYRTTQVETASQDQLIVMLYDGALRFLKRGRDALQAGQPDKAGVHVGRAQAIITELLVTLDRDTGEIADRLAGLYEFCLRTCTTALLRRDPAQIDQVESILRPLREAWAEAGRQLRSERQAGERVERP